MSLPKKSLSEVQSETLRKGEVNLRKDLRDSLEKTGDIERKLLKHKVAKRPGKTHKPKSVADLLTEAEKKEQQAVELPHNDDKG